MHKLITLFVVIVGYIPITAAASTCPDIPPSVGTISRDFKTDVKVSIGSFGRLRMGEVAIKAETAAKNLFDKYPDVNRRAVIEMMYASYCAMVESAAIPDREKLDRLAAFSERLQRLADVTSTTSVPQSEQHRQPQESPSQQSSQEPPKKAYDLPPNRRDEFLQLLRAKQNEPRDTLRIGCVRWSEASCRAAGQFLILFSEAGWTIDSDQVYEVEPAIPVDGISITTRSDETANLEKLPPHLGHWVRTRPSEVVINMAFTQMGVPVHSSRDPSLSPNTIGIYFGPEPSTIAAPAYKRAIRKRVVNFVSNGAGVEQICSEGASEQCMSAQHSWELEVLRYLEAKHFDSSLIQEWKNMKNMGGSPVTQIEKQKNWLVLFFYRLK